MSIPQNNTPLKAWALLLLLSILWGTSFVFGKTLVHIFPTPLLVWLRITIATITLITVLIVTKKTIPLTKPVLSSLLIMGLVNNTIPFSLILIGQPYVSAAEAAILAATVPFFTALYGALLTHDEKVTTPKTLGIIIGFLGTVLVMTPRLHAQPLISNSSLFVTLAAQTSIIAAANAYALGTIYGRRFKIMNVHPHIAATGQAISACLITSIFLIGYTLYTTLNSPDDSPLNWSWYTPQWFHWIELILYGVFCTAIAYLVYFALLSSSGAVYVSLVGQLIPVTTVIIGFLLLNEVLSLIQFVGMAVLGLGLLVFDGRLLKKYNTKSPPTSPPTSPQNTK